jgi:hypothetical protein
VRRATGESGTVTAFVACFVIALLAVAGLVIDGGLVLAARRAAFDEAGAAARAGAQAIDVARLRQGSPAVLDAAEARRLALDHLAITGHQGTVEVSGDVVRVNVRVERELTILGLAGIGPMTVVADGAARAVQGVQRGGD